MCQPKHSPYLITRCLILLFLLLCDRRSSHLCTLAAIPIFCTTFQIIYHHQQNSHEPLARVVATTRPKDCFINQSTRPREMYFPLSLLHHHMQEFRLCDWLWNIKILIYLCLDALDPHFREHRKCFWFAVPHLQLFVPLHLQAGVINSRPSKSRCCF